MTQANFGMACLESGKWPQFPYTHLAVAIYDLENSDEDFEAPKWTELFPDLTEEELEEWGEKNAENRKIVFTTQVKNVAEVLQKVSQLIRYCGL